MAVHAGDGRGMTASGDHDQVTEQIGGLLDHWTVGLAEVVASMAGQKREVSWEATAMPPAGPDLLWWEQPFQTVPGAVVWVATPRSTWEHAGTLRLKAAGLDTVETNEARNTWLEILARISHQFAVKTCRQECRHGTLRACATVACEQTVDDRRGANTRVCRIDTRVDGRR